jgi:hypothetical protein
MLLVEPGEAHTFVSNSPDYYHLVIHAPGLNEADVGEERELVDRSKLGS